MDALSFVPKKHDLPIDSRSRMVIVAAQRARQLMHGVKPLVATKHHAKPTTVALEEVRRGYVKFLVGKEARQATKEARKQRERELERLAAARIAGEDASEIKKDLSVIVDDSKRIEHSEEE